MILRVFTRSTYIQVPGVSCTGCLQKLILPRVEKIYVKNFISLQFSIMSINILIGWVPGKNVTKQLLYIFRLLTEICPVQVHLPSMDLNNPIYFRRQYTCTCNKNNSFSPHSRICQSLWDVTIDGEGLQMFIMAIEQWRCLSVLHLLWHGASVYNDHLRGPVTLTPIAERLAVELTLPVFTT